jgi:S-adenosylmethionine:tRNA ribosyltransferase-isomerase
MRTDDFDFDLPRELIAQHPVRPRDAARLLEVGAEFADRAFRDLPDLLGPGDILVFNDTRVIPSRLAGRRGAARVEVTLHKAEGPGRWRAFARPARKLKPGDRIDFAGGLSAEVAEKAEGGEVGLAFDREGPDLMAALEAEGAMPLPPYIRRQAGPDPRDRDDYQTVFARNDGAVAAPTAGLHFTEAMLAALEARGIRRIAVTLHVGAGTFLPVKTEAAEEHRMHAETGVFEGETDIFILPGYRFKVVDLLLTNFHLPRSTLFMLVSAFAGTQRMKAAYRHAIEDGYRFYSYGDACLLHRADAP